MSLRRSEVTCRFPGRAPISAYPGAWKTRRMEAVHPSPRNRPTRRACPHYFDRSRFPPLCQPCRHECPHFIVSLCRRPCQRFFAHRRQKTTHTIREVMIRAKNQDRKANHRGQRQQQREQGEEHPAGLEQAWQPKEAVGLKSLRNARRPKTAGRRAQNRHFFDREALTKDSSSHMMYRTATSTDRNRSDEKQY